MNLMTRLDFAVGNLMEKAFVLRRRCQPLDLARMLRHAVVSNERKSLKQTFVPNQYVLLLPKEDMARIEPIQEEIVEDLGLVLKEFVGSQGLQVIGPLVVALEASRNENSERIVVQAAIREEA